MKAITVEPHKPETARLADIPEPDARGGSVVVEAIVDPDESLTTRKRAGRPRAV